MDSDTFAVVTGLLSSWRKFPSDRKAFTIALSEWCQNDPKRAEWLLTQRDQFDEYPGPATLRQMIAEHFNPTGPNANYENRPLPSHSHVCLKCGGCGWKISWVLHTVKTFPNGSVYTETQPLNESQFAALAGKLDPQKQKIYSGAERCECGQTGSRQTPWTAEENQLHDARWKQFISDVKNKRLSAGKQKLASQVLGALATIGSRTAPPRKREPGED